MLKPILIRLLGIIFVAAVFAGCSSTPEETAPPPTTAMATPAPAPAPPPPAPTPAPPPPSSVFYFEFDSSVLSAEARQALQAHATILKGNSARVRLEGHCDERGTREYNQALGARRANAAADYLVLQGVSRSRIETISYGEERPVDSRSSEAAWSQNRRVELK